MNPKLFLGALYFLLLNTNFLFTAGEAQVELVNVAGDEFIMSIDQEGTTTFSQKKDTESFSYPVLEVALDSEINFEHDSMIRFHFISLNNF